MAPSRRPARARVRYEIDDRNRLVITRDTSHGQPVRSIEIVDGALDIDRNNRLHYRGLSRSWQFEGEWALTPAHELALTLRATEQSPRHTIYLKGAVADARGNALIFALAGADGADAGSDRLTLTGRWAADADNRLTFAVQKSDSAEDRLTFQAGWEVGAEHELIYRYRRRDTGRRRSDEHVISFEGAWEMPSANRLVYRLSGSSTSAFEFSARLQSRSLLAREGRMVYQVGVTLARGVRRTQRVTLFGVWKLSRDLVVSFEVPYSEGRVRAIKFSGEVALSRRDRIMVELSASDGRRLGVQVAFTRDVSPNVRLFLQARKEPGQALVLGGVRGTF